jgi:intracellular sulfur oxidation DsrE/DsrF family protein
MIDTPQKDSITIIISNDGMGKGDYNLQQKLVSNYLSLLDESGTLPSAICFYTDGVKLVVEGSPVLNQLKSLEDKGVWLVVCQTCLKKYDLIDKIRVGIVGGMSDIIEAQWRAEKVITL